MIVCFLLFFSIHHSPMCDKNPSANLQRDYVFLLNCLRSCFLFSCFSIDRVVGAEYECDRLFSCMNVSCLYRLYELCRRCSILYADTTVRLEFSFCEVCVSCIKCERCEVAIQFACCCGRRDQSCSCCALECYGSVNRKSIALYCIRLLAGLYRTRADFKCIRVITLNGKK